MSTPQRKFNLNVPGSKGTSAGDELRKVETIKENDFRVIPIDKIEPNSKNKYPMIEVEKLYQSIKRVGKILTPLRVRVKDEKFILIAGERRYRSVIMGLEKEDPSFEKYKVGLPCMVEDKTLSEIDEEIQLIEENEERRGPDESLKSIMIARLEELYRIKNMDTGVNTSIPKQIAGVMGMSERQVQRYNAINNKLIPELKEAFEKSKITSTKAAEFAAMDESIQMMIVELLKENDEATKEQIKEITIRAKSLEETHDKQLKQISEMEKYQEELKKKIKEGEENQVNIEELKEKLRRQIEEELERNNPDIETIKKLEKQISSLQEEVKINQIEVGESKKSLEEKDQEIKSLRDDIIYNGKEKKDITPEEKEKIKLDYEIKRTMKEITKQLEQLINTKKKYIKSYNETIQEWDDFQNSTMNILTK